MRSIRWYLALVAALILVAGPVRAQGLTVVNRHERSGFFIGFGFGYGALSIEGADGTEGGMSGMLRIGAALSQRLLIGAETNGWYRSESGTGVTFGTFTGAVHFYPSATNGFFLSGGLGLATFSVEGLDAEYGLGAVLGVGYDARVGRTISITPFLNGFASSIDGVTLGVGQIGTGITFH